MSNIVPVPSGLGLCQLIAVAHETAGTVSWVMATYWVAVIRLCPAPLHGVYGRQQVGEPVAARPEILRHVSNAPTTH
jgi:hypothetical protein